MRWSTCDNGGTATIYLATTPTGTITHKGMADAMQKVYGQPERIANVVAFAIDQRGGTTANEFTVGPAN